MQAVLGLETMGTGAGEYLNVDWSSHAAVCGDATAPAAYATLPAFNLSLPAAGRARNGGGSSAANDLVEQDSGDGQQVGLVSYYGSNVTAWCGSGGFGEAAALPDAPESQTQQCLDYFESSGDGGGDGGGGTSDAAWAVPLVVLLFLCAFSLSFRCKHM